MMFDRNKDADKQDAATPEETKKKGFLSRFKRKQDEPSGQGDTPPPASTSAPLVPTSSTVEVVQTDAPLESEPAVTSEANASVASELSPETKEPGKTRALLSKVKRGLSRNAGPATEQEVKAEVPAVPEPESKSEAGEQAEATKEQGKTRALLSKMKSGLSRTSDSFATGLGNLFLGKKEIDEELLEDIETQLLMADVGLDATTEIIDKLTDRVARKQLADPEALYNALKEELAQLLCNVEGPLELPDSAQPAIILVVGVNGVGKTTTIGKLAKRYQNEGKDVVLAAGDTFRAAAVEQLQAWGERNNVPVIAQHQGADSASVIYDAIASAKSKGADVVIADTAGRLQNKSNLMEELSKVRRVMGKLDETAPHEVLLVLDAGTGQNAISQAEHFSAAAGVTGLALTKLDGTAKGGVIFALSKRFGLPVRFIGVGEGVDDLQPFQAASFVDAIFSSNQ